MDCPFDPVEWKAQHQGVIIEGKVITVFDCPVCGQLVVAGLPHPNDDQVITLEKEG